MQTRPPISARIGTRTEADPALRRARVRSGGCPAGARNRLRRKRLAPVCRRPDDRASDAARAGCPTYSPAPARPGPPGAWARRERLNPNMRTPKNFISQLVDILSIAHPPWKMARIQNLPNMSLLHPCFCPYPHHNLTPSRRPFLHSADGSPYNQPILTGSPSPLRHISSARLWPPTAR